MDILAPGLMWGLAFGRLGCFFNGCCYGGVCVAPVPNDGAVVAQVTLDAREPAYPWAVKFPYGSPAHVDAWERRRVTVPAELIVPRQDGSMLLRANIFGLSVERRVEVQQERDALQGKIDELRKEFGKAKAAGAEKALVAENLATELQAVRTELRELRAEHGLDDLERAQSFPSRKNPQRKTSESELAQLASQCRSPFVHPTQLYSSVNAILLSGLLSAVFYQRKRHGVVIGLVFVLYPIGRFIIELIRTDNPHDALGLTISQFVSVGMFAAGLVYLFVIFKFLPKRASAGA
jgi:phosphatidylglycerol:prolipoprotein diacylglycerol transferase